MPQKTITELQLIGSVTDTLNIPADNGLQSYRFTAAQMKSFILATQAITRSMIEEAQRIPIGVIEAFGGTTAPTGWLICDGSQVSRTTYADLYAVIGNNFGSGNGTTTFHLPDLRGRFVRGRANGQTTDPDRAGRTALNSGGNTGDNVGSAQAYATARPSNAFVTGNESANHTHPQTEARGATGGSFLAATQVATTAGNNVSTGIQSSNHTHTVTSGGDNETRPINVYVNYIIKF
jgi:microcystin-dependent protein